MREQLIKIMVDEYDALEHDLDAVIKLEADTESVLRCMEKALLIQRVSHRRELLISFAEYWNLTDSAIIDEDDIDYYLKEINCG